MNRFRPWSLLLVMSATLAGCATGPVGSTGGVRRDASAEALAGCKPFQPVVITAVTPGTRKITLDLPTACVAPGAALVMWRFDRSVTGYVFAPDAVTLKDGQSPGLIFAKGNKLRYFAVFDNDAEAIWDYNLKIVSSDGRQTWFCDPTITNRTITFVDGPRLSGEISCAVTPS